MKRSASSSVSAPGRSQVYAQFAADSASSAAVASSRSVRSSPSSRALAEERAEPLLVAAALGDELLAALALEVAPLAHEHGRDVELLGDDAEMRAQRGPDPLDHRPVVRNGVERGVERRRALARDLPQQVGLRLDVRVERALLHAHRLGEIADRRAVVALLREEAGGGAG